MRRVPGISPTLALVGILAALLAFPAGALAHGGEADEASEPSAGVEQRSPEAQVEELSIQPARVLAQQALSTLRVLDDVEDAAIRLDAALLSKDDSDVDSALLRRATETLDGGSPQAAIALLDEALSRPLGSDSGKALHAAGREFRPATGTEELVAISLGALLVAIGAAALWRTRTAGPRS